MRINLEWQRMTISICQREKKNKNWNVSNAQHDGCHAKYRWHPLLNAAKFSWHVTPTAWVPCSNAANIGECKTWMQSEFCTWQNSVGGQEPWKCTYSVPAQEMAKHRAKFGWPPLSDVGSVTTQRRETCWNLLGCPKLTNRSQLLVGRSCEDTWRRYCCLTSFFPQLRRYSPTKLRDGAQMAIFASCIFSEPPAVHFWHAF